MNFSNLCLALKKDAFAGPYLSTGAAKATGAITLSYGLFINGMISFLIVAFVVFLFIKGIIRLRHGKEAPPAAPSALGISALQRRHLHTLRVEDPVSW